MWGISQHKMSDISSHCPSRPPRLWKHTLVSTLWKRHKMVTMSTQVSQKSKSYHQLIKVSRKPEVHRGLFLPCWYKIRRNTYLTENISGEDMEVELLSMLFSWVLKTSSNACSETWSSSCITYICSKTQSKFQYTCIYKIIYNAQSI